MTPSLPQGDWMYSHVSYFQLKRGSAVKSWKYIYFTSSELLTSCFAMLLKNIEPHVGWKHPVKLWKCVFIIILKHTICSWIEPYNSIKIECPSDITSAVKSEGILKFCVDSRTVYTFDVIKFRC